ncbi:MAG: HDOD domain-containing protein [Calditrichaeota bacterium]|nr:HDOD domain-containing protein [Calditrichota bacterium]
MQAATVSTDLAKIVRRIKNLPTLPVVVTQLMEAVNNPSFSASDVSRIISNDQALVSKILRIVNSAFYGLPKRVSTVTQATVILGFNTIKNLALGATVFEMFSKGTGEDDSCNRAEFWKHSIGTGVATKLLAREIRYSNPEEAFVSGLIHDIGKVVLDQFLHNEFAEVCRVAREDGIRFIDAERIVLNVTHGEIGHWLAQKWNLPNQLDESIWLHHDPGAARHAPRLVAMVHLADAIARMEHIGFAGDEVEPEMNPAIWDVLRLPSDAMENVLANFPKEFERSAIFLKLAAE